MPLKIKITADSTCDLPPEVVERYGIDIVPLYIDLDGKVCHDGVDATPQMIYDMFDAKGVLPKTAAASVQDYIDLFTQYQNQGYEIVHLNISSEFSSCHQNACLAAREVGGAIYPVDSRNLSSGTGLLVLRACELAGEGLSGAQIKDRLDEMTGLVDASFVICSMIYLHKGGRCSAVAAFVGNALGIKPNINVRDGKMGVGKKYRGPYVKCLEKYVADKLEPQKDQIDTRRIFITRSSENPEADAAVREAIGRVLHFDEIITSYAGCTISGHCGPDCLGILFMRKP